MSEITLQSIEKKLGFKPFHAPLAENKNPYLIDDHTPSLYNKLTHEELGFLVKLLEEKLLNGEIKPVEWK